MTGPALEITAATMMLGGSPIWSDVTVEIGMGDFVAILGPNGAGKSSLIKAILGLLPLAAGEIRLFGGPVHDGRHLVGYLPQRRSFDASLRIRGVDIVRLGLDGHRWGIPGIGLHGGTTGRQARARVEEVIGLVGAGAYARRPIGQCSGGEQQRLLIAQALVRRPQVLLLDEPLDGLDLPNQSSVAALISEISRDQDVTLLMVAHNVNPIVSYLDRVVYLGPDGVAVGSVEQVISGDTLTRLYNTSIEVLRTSDGRLVVVGQPDAPGDHHDRHGHRT